MANSSIVEWTIENSSRLNLEVTRVTWVDEWLPGYFDYQVRIAACGKTYTGRGIDAVEDLAFAKAVAEALERAATCGLRDCWATAAYPDLFGAKERAYSELLGIDKVLCHHYCRRRVRILGQEALGTSFPIKPFLKMLKKNRLEVTVLELTPSLDARVAGVFVSSLDPACAIKGFVKGYGVEKTLESAVIHALIECMRNSVTVFLGGATPNPGELSCDATNPRWHFWQAQTAESLKYLRTHFVAGAVAGSRLEPEIVSITDATFTRINTLDSIFPEVPLCFVQAHSDKLLKPQFGKFQGDALTMKRLEAFNGGQIELPTDIPHFYG